MRTIGLLGGVSWTSTAEYYRRLNKLINAKLGGLSSAKILLHSFNFAEIVHYQSSKASDAEALMLIKAARDLERSGAEVILICSNTTHQTACRVQAALSIPLIHLIEATAEEVSRHHIETIGVLGTHSVMYGEFYTAIFKKFGITVKVLDERKGRKVHNIIYDELCRNVYAAPSKEFLLSMIDELYCQGSKAVILGCTELPLIISQHDTPIKIFDSIQIHVDKVIEFALVSP